MKFNSKSVVLNRGVNYRYPIETPPVFKHYKFRPDVLRNAVNEFNQKLDLRPHVTMHIDGVKADVLRLVPTADDTLAMWLVVKEKDVDKIHEICFTIKGDVYFDGDSEVNVDHMVIQDVWFNDSHGIFADKKKH
jgi:hypothetical protein